MPPTQNSFNIKQNTPEAEKLIQRLHEHLKEIIGPAVDLAVPQYVTACLAKGHDRKKLQRTLKDILDEEIVTQLLDWLYKHLRLHGSEYQSKIAPASSKPAPKPPASTAKVVPTEEVELRLEDLEAQQLEGSDLEDDVEANDTAAAAANAAEEATGSSKRDNAAQPQQGIRGLTQPERPPEPATRPAQAPGLDGRNGGADAQATGKPDRIERRHREPIPVPNFSDPSRSRSGGGAGPSAQIPTAPRGGAPTGAAPQAATAPEQPSTKQAPPQRAKQQQASKQQLQPPAAAAERRRLKSSVVLDWESWQKQKQPGDEPLSSRAVAASEKAAVPERAPTLPRARQDGADQPAQEPASQRERGDGRDRDREKDRERGQDRDRGRRWQPNEVDGDMASTRYRDGDGDASARRGHDRESEGGARRRGGSGGGEAAHRSRSRSRSRSPRGRRQGRAPLGMANLLRSALREVDGMAGPRGSKPSVFERLGAGGAAMEAAPARAPAVQRLGGSDKAERADKVERAMDTSGSGRKRGPEDGVDPDAAVLGSPPKAARGPPAHKSGALAGDERRPAGAGTGPPTGRQRLEFAPAAAVATDVAGDDGGRGSGSRKRDAERGPGVGNGPPAGKLPAAAAAAAAADAGVDPSAAELEALRQQMAAMAEKLARMEAAKEVSPQPLAPPQPQAPPQPAAQAQVQLPPQPMQPQHQQPRQPAVQPRPQTQPPLQPHLQLRPQLQQPLPQPQQQVATESRHVPIAARLQQPGPAGLQAMGGRPAPGVRGAGGGSGGAGGATILPTSMSDWVIEGGSGSPPRKQAGQQPEAPPQPPPPQSRPDQQRLAAAQLEADLRSVVVENVHFLANKEVLAAHFSVVGPVKNVTLVHDRLTGAPSGVAVVEMANEQATQAAAALSGSLLMDLPIAVTLKAELMLQGINMGGGVGVNPAPIVGVPPGPPGVVPGGRLNPAAAPFVPGLAAMAGALPGVGLGRGAAGAVRPPLGAVGPAGRQPWGPGAGGGRGRGSNVWMREPARSGNGVGANAAERG